MQRQNIGCAAALWSPLQGRVKEDCRQIKLRLRVFGGHVDLEAPAGLLEAQERRIGRDQPVAAGEQASGLGRALGGGAEDGGRRVVALLGEGSLELGLELGRVDPPEAVAGGGGRVDQGAQLWGVLEERVEPFEGGGHVRVVAGQAVASRRAGP